MNQPYRVVEHTADWALKVFGEDLAQLFANAARGMASLIAGDEPQGGRVEAREINLEAGDRESLLVIWLEEFAFWAETERLVLWDLERLEATATRVQASVQVTEVPALQKHIKAVTYHNLAIQEIAEGLETTIVFDV